MVNVNKRLYMVESENSRNTASAKNGTAGKSSAKDLLEQLEVLDERLQKLENFFASSKNQSEENSLFTEENIRKILDLTRQLDPNDIYFIHALKQFIPLARLPLGSFKNNSVVSQPSVQVVSGGSPTADSRRLQKLTNKIPQNRII